MIEKERERPNEQGPSLGRHSRRPQSQAKLPGTKIKVSRGSGRDADNREQQRTEQSKGKPLPCGKNGARASLKIWGTPPGVQNRRPPPAQGSHARGWGRMEMHWRGEVACEEVSSFFLPVISILGHRVLTPGCRMPAFLFQHGFRCLTCSLMSFLPLGLSSCTLCACRNPGALLEGEALSLSIAQAPRPRWEGKRGRASLKVRVT